MSPSLVFVPLLQVQPLRQRKTWRKQALAGSTLVLGRREGGCRSQSQTARNLIGFCRSVLHSNWNKMATGPCTKEIPAKSEQVAHPQALAGGTLVLGPRGGAADLKAKRRATRSIFAGMFCPATVKR